MIAQGVSLNLGLADSASLAGQKHQGSPESVSTETGLLKHYPWFLCRCWEWNLGSHACLWTLRLSHLLSTRMRLVYTLAFTYSMAIQCDEDSTSLPSWSCECLPLSSITQEYPHSLDFHQYLTKYQRRTTCEEERFIWVYGWGVSACGFWSHDKAV